MTNQALELPLNLALGVGAYTTKLWLGSEQVEVNVLIDTGSSTLAVNPTAYKAENDHAMLASSYAQSVVYGKGGWAGPVIYTTITLNQDKKNVLKNAPLAIAEACPENMFQQADGIWGLAYHHLNKAYEVTTKLNQLEPAVKTTFPWPFKQLVSESGVPLFKKQLQKFPEQDITPLFTAFEENNIIPNQFALTTHRAVTYVPYTGMSESAIADHPLNKGLFHIGKKFKPDKKLSMKILHEAYYNAQLLEVWVEGFGSIKAPPLEPVKVNNFFTNAIIDSGCSFLILQKSLYHYVLECFKTINPSFNGMIDLANQAYLKGEKYTINQMNLSQWPDIFFKFLSKNDTSITLKITPDLYWLKHAEKPNNWMFMLMEQLPQWPNQTIFGLPIMNNYTCVFDRNDSDNGAIHWLPKELQDRQQ